LVREPESKIALMPLSILKFSFVYRIDTNKSTNICDFEVGSISDSINSLNMTAMEQLGFVPDETGFTTLNENRYFSTTWLYQSRYATDFSLRPHLRLEFTLRVPVCPPKPISMTYLVYQKAEILEGRFSMMCVTIEEILAEKVLSFLRRHAQHRSGHMQQWDTALVRHIYDVFCIVTADANAVTKAKWHFKDLVKFDVLELSQHDEFVEHPRECLRNALTVVELEEQTKNEYQTKLLPLIYGENRPDFVDAFNVFKHCAIALIDTL